MVRRGSLFLAIATMFYCASSSAQAADNLAFFSFKGLYLGSSKTLIQSGNKNTRQSNYLHKTIKFNLSKAKLTNVFDSNKDTLISVKDIPKQSIIKISARLNLESLPAKIKASRLILKEAPTILDPGPTQPDPDPMPEPDPTPEPDPDPTPTHNQLRGFDIGSTFYHFDEEPGMQDINLAHDMGSDVVRMIINWSALEPNQDDVYNPALLAQLDKYFAEIKNKDMKIVATTLLTPCWASSMDCAANYNYLINAPTDNAYYKDFVKFAANRWGDKIHAFEVWNEPNHSGFWQGTHQQYVNLVKAADEGVAASNYPNTLILAGSLAGSDGAYLQALYDKGLGSYSDAVSIHPYEISWGGADMGFRDPTVARPGGEFGSFTSGPPYIHALMESNNDHDPIWITEFGYATCPATPFCVSQADHADYMSGALEVASTWDFLDGMILFRLRDYPNSNGDWNYHFGLFNADFTPKLAASRVKETFADLK